MAGDTVTAGQSAAERAWTEICSIYSMTEVQARKARAFFDAGYAAGAWEQAGRGAELLDALVEADDADIEQAITWWADDFCLYMKYPENVPNRDRPVPAARRIGEALRELMKLSGWKWPEPAALAAKEPGDAEAAT